MASSYSDLERNADFAFYFSSPHLGSVAPRLPNTANTAFIQTRQVNQLTPSLGYFRVLQNNKILSNMCFKVFGHSVRELQNSQIKMPVQAWEET